MLPYVQTTLENIHGLSGGHRVFMDKVDIKSDKMCEREVQASRFPYSCKSEMLSFSSIFLAFIVSKNKNKYVSFTGQMT